MATTKLTFVTVLIDRDAHVKLPTTVADYEVPILEEIYGEELISEVGSQVVEVENFDPEFAYQALITKYKGSADADAARKRLYPRAADLTSRFKASKAKASKAEEPAE